MTFHRDILRIDARAIAEELESNLRRDVRQTLRRSGAAGTSGGLDSSYWLCAPRLSAPKECSA